MRSLFSGLQSLTLRRLRLDALGPAVIACRGRRAGEDEISVLIPAFQAEKFLDRTLFFARGQTHTALRILVSVDAGGDNTTGVARRHAALDDRVVVHEQPTRLGWANNINFLLSKVETPYFFIYPHDDIVLPHYAQALLEVLKAEPALVSVHCNMGHFGGGDHISVASDYTGSADQRLMHFLVARQRGSPLRSLVRRDATDDLRLPSDSIGGLWANEPFLMELVARGQARAYHETLYLRWDKRPGGLTDSWAREKPDVLMGAYRQKLATEISLIEKYSSSERSCKGLKIAVLLKTISRIRMIENQRGLQYFERVEDLDARLAGIRLADLIECVDPQLQADADALVSAQFGDPRIAGLT